MSRLSLSERIVIECGIYQKLSLGKIAKKIGKTTECVSRKIRANRTIAPGEHHFGKDCHYAGECKTKGLCGKDGCSRRCVTCREYDCRELCTRYNKPLALYFPNRRMFAMFVCGEENAKQIELTTMLSKQMQWQSGDIPTPEARYKPVVKTLKNLINWFHR